MTTFSSIDAVEDFMRDGVLAIGNFDGVHVGHQALVRKVNEIKGLRPGGVLTFDPHPKHYFNRDQAFFCLSASHHKARMLHEMGLEAVIIHPLCSDFLSLSPRQFVRSVLHEKLQIKDVVVGDDFSFGAGARGKIADLKRLGQECSMNIHVVPAILSGKERCSSSAIRHYLEEGLLDKARPMLGRPFSLFGRVRPDQKKGASLGFATANLKPKDFFLKRGVYASVTRVFSGHGHQDFLSATNVGVRPSVTSAQELVVETHCLDQLLELGGQEIEIFFIEFLREEIKFPSIKALQEQVQKDFQAVRQAFHLHPERFDPAR